MYMDFVSLPLHKPLVVSSSIHKKKTKKQTMYELLNWNADVEVDTNDVTVFFVYTIGKVTVTLVLFALLPFIVEEILCFPLYV